MSKYVSAKCHLNNTIHFGNIVYKRYKVTKIQKCNVQMLQNIYFVTYIQRKWLLKLRHKETRYETKEEKKMFRITNKDYV